MPPGAAPLPRPHRVPAHPGQGVAPQRAQDGRPRHRVGRDGRRRQPRPARRRRASTVNRDVDNVGVAMLLMNIDRPPLDDLRVRQAIVSAIDREAFRDAVAGTSFELADQPYGEASTWHAAVDYPAFDPDRARDLVDRGARPSTDPSSHQIMLSRRQRPAGPAVPAAGARARSASRWTSRRSSWPRFVQQFVGGRLRHRLPRRLLRRRRPRRLVPVHHLEGRRPRDADQAQLRPLPQPGGRRRPAGSSGAPTTRPPAGPRGRRSGTRSPPICPTRSSTTTTSPG